MVEVVITPQKPFWAAQIYERDFVGRKVLCWGESLFSLLFWPEYWGH
jgi:hypothetical protein